MTAPATAGNEHPAPGLNAVSRSVAHLDLALLAAAAVEARRSRTGGRLLVAGLATTGTVTALALRLGARSGVTGAEVMYPRPGDDLVRDPRYIIDRGTTIHAPAREMWPWLVPMGYHRGGWYTNGTLDRVVWHIDNPSVDRVVPELQALAIRDVVADVPPGTAHWKVAGLEPERALVLLDDEGTHVPATVCSWSSFLDPVDERTTRVLTRSRFGYAPDPRMGALVRLLIGPADLLMTGQMLRGVRQRVAGAAALSPAR